MLFHENNNLLSTLFSGHRVAITHSRHPNERVSIKQKPFHSHIFHLMPPVSFIPFSHSASLPFIANIFGIDMACSAVGVFSLHLNTLFSCSPIPSAPLAVQSFQHTIRTRKMLYSSFQCCSGFTVCRRCQEVDDRARQGSIVKLTLMTKGMAAWKTRSKSKVYVYYKFISMSHSFMISPKTEEKETTTGENLNYEGK